jgi:hypothetical protein
MKVLVEVFGWYGAFAIMSAYALVSFAVLEPSSIWYQILNLTGAIGIVATSFHKKNYSPGVLNIMWAIIAGVALITLLS